MSANAQPHESPAAQRKTQIRVLDDVWLLTLFALLLTTGVPWFVSGFDIAFGPVLLGALGLGALHVALAFLGESTTFTGAWRVPMLTALHAAGVVTMGIVWHNSGGLQNPAALTAFVLPVIGACFISRWQPYFTAGLAIVVVALAALIEAPELRWHASGLGAAAMSLLADAKPSAAPFPGFYAPSGYYVTLLQGFIVVTLVTAAAADYLGTLFERQRAHTELARERAQSGRELWTSLVEHLPVPTLLVEVDTLRVLRLSESAAPLLLPREEDAKAIGRNVLDTIRFSYPEAVRSLIRGDAGPARPCTLRVGDDLHIANVSVRHLGYEGRALALLTVEDVTDAFCTRAALDKAEEAVLIVDSKTRVITFNKHARALFPDADVGIEAARLLSHPGQSALPWWDPGLRGRRKRLVEIDARIYQMTSSTVPLAGEEESFFVLGFVPVVGAASANEAARITNLQHSTLVRPR
jgi:PAS domain-containing protein